jgi:hypothetical protein
MPIRLTALSQRAALIALPFLLITETAVQACSMAPGYKVPTNLELTALADTIVVATVEDERKAGDSWNGVVLVRPTFLIKGATLPGMIELSRAYLGPDEQLPATNDVSVLRAWRDSHGGWPARKSDPRELRRVNPDALTGGCVRYIFSKGMKLVLFPRRDTDGTLKPYRSSFSRDAEDVPSDDALWVKAVREYVVIADHPAKERKAALKARIAELSQQPNDPDAMAIAKDMKVELAGKRLPPFD